VSVCLRASSCTLSCLPLLVSVLLSAYFLLVMCRQCITATSKLHALRPVSVSVSGLSPLLLCQIIRHSVTSSYWALTSPSFSVILSAHLVKLGKLMQERKKDQAQASVLEFFREFGTHVLPGPILWGGLVRSKKSRKKSRKLFCLGPSSGVLWYHHVVRLMGIGIGVL